ncbi:MAG: FtsX-like permease family protein [Bacteroidota bacterium]
MDFRFLIARRLLASPRRISLVSVLSGLSVAGVALGVTALIVVLSVMNGFFGVVRDLLVSFDPHVRIVATAQHEGLTEADSLRALALTLDPVISATPYVQGKALLTTDGGGDFNKVVIVRGIDPAQGPRDSGPAAAVTFGGFDLGVAEGQPGVVVGGSLASRLGLYPGTTPTRGSRIDLLSAPALERMLVQYPFGLPAAARFTVRGVYEMDEVFDQSNVYVALDQAQRLFRMGDRVSGLDLHLDDLDRAEAVKQALVEQLDAERYTVQTWYDLQQSLYAIMRLEKWGASLILALIIVVAAFNIVGSLTMIVVEKRRDLGALQAMGASRRDIRRIFLIEGMLVGGLGAGLGLVLGLGLAWAQQQYGLVKLAGAESFIIDAYPVDIQALDVAGIVVVALALCVAASVYPAARAARIEPADAVRNGG